MPSRPIKPGHATLAPMPNDPILTTLTGQVGQRLDVALRDGLGLSRSAALRLLEAGRVRVNERVVGGSQKGRLIGAGDMVTVQGPADEMEAPRPDPTLKLNVLAEGDGWLAVDKPAGVPVRPHHLDELGTVVNAVAALQPKIVGVGEGGLRSGVVHRLDTDTSGVLVVATSQAAWEHWRAGFAEHRTAKRYRALVTGRFEQAGRVERDLSMAGHRPARVRVNLPDAGPADARHCAMSIEVVEHLRDATLITVDLETGFLHQIRAMMASLGHAVLGDHDYGDDSVASAAPRQMLHAGRLALYLNSIESPVPKDMACCIEQLREES